MADLIVIRLYPKKPTDPTTFANDLAGLTITVMERSVKDPKGVTAGQVIGSAFYDPTNINSRIVQDLLPPFGFPASAATAVIDVGAFEPPGYAEYQTSDLRLTIARGTQTIVDTSLNYNVALETGVVPLNGKDPFAPAQYTSFASVALYLALPAAAVGVNAGQAYVDIPTDGSPPNFKQLRDGVKTVLLQDPGPSTLTDPQIDTLITGLTAEQCRHVAYEIFWNRILNPLPALTPGTLELYYTSPGSSGYDTDRQQFESDLTAYYTTGNTQADVLAKYVFALSASLACQQLTIAAANAGFELPILPGVTGPSGKVAETDVILSD